jgi:hypothetical protein
MAIDENIPGELPAVFSRCMSVILRRVHGLLD